MQTQTLALLAVKGLFYFAVHDYNAIQLVEKAELWSTGLDTDRMIIMFEILFFLYTRYPSIKKSLKMLYKY